MKGTLTCAKKKKPEPLLPPSSGGSRFFQNYGIHLQDTKIYPHHPLLKVQISYNEHVISSLESKKKKADSFSHT